MNTSVIWANIFSQQLNCVSCRKYKETSLFYMDGTPVDAHQMTINDLMDNVDSFDVWCSTCTVKKTWKVLTEGRTQRKKEAARLAKISAPRGAWNASLEHVVEKGVRVSADAFIQSAKSFPCTLCGVSYPTYIMDFHHILKKSYAISKMKNNTHSIEAIVREMEKCVLVCGNCHRTLHYSPFLLPLPLWSYEDHKDAIFQLLKGTKHEEVMAEGRLKENLHIAHVYPKEG